MTELIDILRKETQSLKDQYLQLTEEYSKKSFELLQEKKDRPIEKWYNAYGIKYYYEKTTVHIARGEYHRKDLYKMSDDRALCFAVVKAGYDRYLQKNLKNAENHYENSLQKLVNRILQKQLNWENLTVKTSHVGVNIECVLTDGEKTVKAWTIIASGPVQKPHYRYLIK